MKCCCAYKSTLQTRPRRPPASCVDLLRADPRPTPIHTDNWAPFRKPNINDHWIAQRLSIEPRDTRLKRKPGRPQASPSSRKTPTWKLSSRAFEVPQGSTSSRRTTSASGRSCRNLSTSTDTCSSRRGRKLTPSRSKPAPRRRGGSWLLSVSGGLRHGWPLSELTRRTSARQRPFLFKRSWIIRTTRSLRAAQPRHSVRRYYRPVIIAAAGLGWWWRAASLLPWSALQPCLDKF